MTTSEKTEIRRIAGDWHYDNAGINIVPVTLIIYSYRAQNEEHDDMYGGVVLNNSDCDVIWQKEHYPKSTCVLPDLGKSTACYFTHAYTNAGDCTLL
jgi:hypothetical protein